MQIYDEFEDIQMVVFKIDKEEYGVDILHVQEIKKMTEITRVPHTPKYLKGVINLRGSVLPIIDLRCRLNLKSQERTEETRIIIVKVEEIIVGLIVDAVSEVLNIPVSAVDTSQNIKSNVSGEHVEGVGKLEDRLIIILNLKAILGQEQVS